MTRRKRTRQEKEPSVTVNAEGEATLCLWIGNETSIELDLEQPTELRLPHGRETVTKIAIYVDEPKSFMDEVRRHIG